jgi:hypothetical protein
MLFWGLLAAMIRRDRGGRGGNNGMYRLQYHVVTHQITDKDGKIFFMIED